MKILKAIGSSLLMICVDVVVWSGMMSMINSTGHEGHSLPYSIISGIAVVVVLLLIYLFFGRKKEHRLAQWIYFALLPTLILFAIFIFSIIANGNAGNPYWNAFYMRDSISQPIIYIVIFSVISGVFELILQKIRKEK